MEFRTLLHLIKLRTLKSPTNRSANWCMICAWHASEFAVFCLYNRQMLVSWWSFFKVTIRCKNKSISLHLFIDSHLLIFFLTKQMSELQSNVYSVHTFHRNTWIHVLNIFFLLYWFNCLLETDCWQNSKVLRALTLHYKLIK
jgi:hypothetical protein